MGIRTQGINRLDRDPFLRQSEITITGTGPVEVPSFEKAKSALPATTSDVSSDVSIESRLKPTAESQELKAARQFQGAAGAISAMAGIVNAFVTYEQVKSRAKLNIQLAHQQALEAVGIGREKALKEETKGISRGKEALLSAVAQGQEVSGAFAQNLQKQEELFGVYSAMQVEINAMRQAYGYDAEATLYESDIRQAKIRRDTEIFNSVLQGGTSVLGAML